MRNRNRRTPARVVTPAERMAYARIIDGQNPGYLEENVKLLSIVKILTGVRVVYGLFYFAMTFLYGLSMTQGFLTLFSAFVFYIWYSVMLRTGKIVAVLMMVFRGGSIVFSGVSILQMSFWLPYPLIFTLVAAAVMEFCEAVFCIYVLFNRQAARAIRLNREMDVTLSKGVSPKTLERMAEYQNPYGAPEDGEETENAKKADNGWGAGERPESGEEMSKAEKEPSDAERRAQEEAACSRTDQSVE